MCIFESIRPRIRNGRFRSVRSCIVIVAVVIVVVVAVVVESYSFLRIIIVVVLDHPQ